MNHKPRTIQTLLAFFALLLLLVVVSPTHAQSLQFVPVISAYSGTGTGGYIDGSATTAEFSSPHISDMDIAGNLYVPDTTNGLVRKVDPSGNACTYAGIATGTVTPCPGMPAGTVVCAAKTDSVGDGCPATQATLNMPKGLRVDPFGNIVIADVNNNRIRSINAQTGIITTIVGTGSANNGTPFASGAIANTIKLFHPFDLAFDKSGNLYINDTNDNYVILVMAVNGAIVPGTSKSYIIGGTGTEGHTAGDGGIASNADMDLPRGITVDASGNVYTSDFTNNTIRVITAPIQNGTLNLATSFISTYAGNGTVGTVGTASAPCCTGDGGPALQASISAPQGIALDAAGNLYITQFTAGYEAIRKVTAATGTISTFVGTGPNAHTGDGGAAIAAAIFSSAGLSFDRYGRALIDDSSNNRIRVVQATTTFATTNVLQTTAASNVVALATQAVTPKTVSVTTNTHDFTIGTMTGCTLNTSAAKGALCSIPVKFAPTAPGVRTTAVSITDSNSNVSQTGVIGIGNAPAVAYTPAAIHTIAGNGTAGSTGNNSLASLATVNAPRGSVIDASGSLVFADSGSNMVRRIDHTTGTITVLAGTGTSGYTGDTGLATAATLKAPTDVVLDPVGNLYIADTGNNCIRMVNAATGIITTIAGTTTAGYTGDLGLATAATLNAPSGLAIDFAGLLYVADTGNHAIRRFYPIGGYITTIAGTGTAGYSGDSAKATAATLNAPSAVVLDPAGDIFIADTGNNVVREVSPMGIISTYAGTHGITSNSGDGSAATSAGLQSPSDVALDAAGDLYIAAGGQVRMVNTAGVITTVAGTGSAGNYSGEGGAATLATIPGPAKNLAVDSGANIYISSTTGNTILTVSAATAPTLDFGTQAPQTSGASRTISIVNVGNLPLTLSGLSVSANYTLQSTAATACTATTQLAAGASCTLSIVFSPGMALGTMNGSVVLTDNALNGTSATQTIPLTGISAVPANPTTTVLTYNPAIALTYGTSITLTATVTGTALTGSVIFAVDGVGVGTVPLTAGVATLPMVHLAAGQRTLTATYTNDTANATSTGTLMLPVQPTLLTVTADNQTRHLGEPNPTLSYKIAGFAYGETSSVVFGSAVFTTTATNASPIGTYPIALSSSTLNASNYIFTYAGATLTIVPPDFTLTATPGSITMASGQSAAATITLTPLGSYQGTVNLSCGSLPAYVTCTFSSPTLTADGTGSIQQTQLEIATDNFNHLAGVAGQGNRLMLALALLPVFALFGLRRRRNLQRLLFAVTLLLSVSTLVACGNAGQIKAAAGTNTISLTAKDASGLSHNFTLTLTLQ